MKASITPSQKTRFAVYARLSKDPDGTKTAVERQLAHCRELVKSMDGEVVAELIDPDISAFSGATRPEYERLKSMMINKEIDAVAGWKFDRINRRVMDSMGYWEIMEATKTPTYTVKSGNVTDFSAASFFVYVINSGLGEHEVRGSRERVQDAKLNAARKGLPSGGNRGYGYKQSGFEFEPTERKHLLWMAQQYIAGDSYRTIAIKLNERGVPTAKGHKWRGINLRNVLLSKRNIGIRVHNGEEYPAQWPRLFDDDTWQLILMTQASRHELYKQRGPSRSYLLTGFAYCGLCGEQLHAKWNQRHQSVYVCEKRLQHDGATHGCGRIVRHTEPTDILITECILTRLESPALADAIAEHRPTDMGRVQLQQLLAEQRKQQTRLQEIIDDYATAKIDKREYNAFKLAATTRLEALGREIERLSAQHAVGSLPVGQTARSPWEKSDLAWKRQVVDLLTERVVVNPSPGARHMPDKEKFLGKYRFVPEDVRIIWKV